MSFLPHPASIKPCFLFSILLMLYILPALAASDQDKYVAGTHYEALAQPVPTNDPSRIEVVELFWYGCPHCYHFEPSLKTWVAALPKDVDFERMPAMWSDAMTVHAKIFYTAKQFKKLDAMHDAIFTALQVQKKRLTEEGEISQFFANYGVNPKEFSSTFNSFIVDSAVRQAEDKARAYKMNGTPTLVVNGKYTISARENVSQADMLNIASFLIEKERASMKAVKK